MRWRPATRFEYSPTEESELRVITWNVGYFSVVKDKNIRRVDLKSISELISKVDADVIILQELGATNQAEDVVNDLKGNWNAYSTLTGHGNQTLAH